jgi:hypothetical protein
VSAPEPCAHGFAYWSTCHKCGEEYDLERAPAKLAELMRFADRSGREQALRMLQAAPEPADEHETRARQLAVVRFLEERVAEH